jgi:DNA/RNA endonuclease YhcR with UshA esterase domain
MKWRFPVLGLFAVLALCLFALPIYAQTAAVTTRPVAPLRYDITKEVKLSGTVSEVAKSPTRGMNKAAGSHLILETEKGPVDADLGARSIRAKSAFSVTAGEYVEVTGVMKTVNNKQVFVARLVELNGHVYKIRNEHGFVYHRISRDGVTNSESKGGQL